MNQHRRTDPPEARLAQKGGWESVAKWYDQLVGPQGSAQHQGAVLPAVLGLLQPQRGEHVLDLACGQGVLAPLLAKHAVHYTGVDASPTLIKLAFQRHRAHGKFLTGDVRFLPQNKNLQPHSFDAVTIVLALQDVDPLEGVFAGIAWALKPGGRAVLAMTHPCFRIPRQSGWGWDEGRKLVYRRVDRYLTPMAVPMRATHGQETGGTTSFHRSLETYVNGLTAHGLAINAIKELPLFREPGKNLPGARAKAERTASQEIPQFLVLRAYSSGGS